MPAVLDTLRIVNINPPLILPTIYVTLEVGETKIITRAMVNSAQTYYQSQNVEIGSIDIVNSLSNYQHLLSQYNNTSTIAYFMNAGSRVYRTASYGVNVTNGYVQRTTINNNTFRVVGRKIGTATVTYRATAHNGTLESASTMAVVGQIVIKVVLKNRPPSKLQGASQDVIYDSLTTLGAEMFVYAYADPEGDEPYMVLITTLPTKGNLWYQGQMVTDAIEIPYAHIQQGMLVYINDGSISTIGSTDTFRHTVSDTGSQQYY